MSNIKIVPWDDSYHQKYISLAIEWLEKYVSVEPADLEILNYPQKNVLDNGGQIFFAKDRENIVGTVSMIKIDCSSYELAKLAVTESYKGMGIGNLLMESALQFAKDNKASNVILYTNHKLKPAIHMYRKYGFCEVALENNKYLESDIKMMLKL